MELHKIDAVSAAAEIRAGKITSEQLVRAHLKHILKTEKTVRAWAYIDPDYALMQARQADRARESGKKLRPLHGIPVGIKDIFDTTDMPTENGTVLHAGRKPSEDARVVALLREAGAVIMGKTVTTELAVYAPGKTTNPHDFRRTPGGSSSGSAAAVAGFMVPLALGTQTNGSVIRPASYCGVYGYKPTKGLISRQGVLKLSRSLDQVGVFARTVADAALIARQLIAYDPKDPDTIPLEHSDFSAIQRQGPPIKPRLAFIKTPMWDQALPIAKKAFAGLVKRLGRRVTEIKLPEIFNQAVEWHRIIMETDLAKSFENEYNNGKDQLSATLLKMIERGRKTDEGDYRRAREAIPRLARELDTIFADFDAILTPATTAEAPVGLTSTGNPVFCTIWTLCGFPAICVPVLKGRDNMPMGAQLVAAKGKDMHLLKVAQWLGDGRFL